MLKQPPRKVLSEACRLYRDYLSRRIYPEDTWLAVDPFWDINLFTDDQNKGCATIYPVHNDETDVTQPFPILLEY